MAVKDFDSKFIIKLLVFVMLSGTYGSFAGSKQKIINFSKAKRILKKNIYNSRLERRTFYCGCSYQKKSIKLKTCKVLTKKFKKRKSRLEWEHIVPAHAFGQSFSEWRNAKKVCPKKKGARKCARRMNKVFSEMEGDLFNLVPSVGAVNAMRSNFSFTEFSKNYLSLCHNGLKIYGRKVSPPNSKKGDIARIYMYMEKKYPGHGVISRKKRKLFLAWDKLDPVDKEECQISRKKSKYQGNLNVFVEKHCKEIFPKRVK